MDPETRERATAAVEALQIMAANSSNRLGDIVGLVQCGLIGYGLWIMHRGNADRAEQQQSQAEQMKSQQQSQQQQTATLADIGTALRQQGAVLADIGAGIQELLRDRHATRQAD